jgi:hypothetical protein
MLDKQRSRMMSPEEKQTVGQVTNTPEKKLLEKWKDEPRLLTSH